uniref:RNA-binding protein 28 isoform X1 n=1 Tax=Petromyzon marinus TaxID=7757 RepID=A0AAJ7TFV0_PETMA|nr:RNA-binding protein 28 isoform X1 [Petromyzon marinus]
MMSSPGEPIERANWGSEDADMAAPVRATGASLFVRGLPRDASAAGLEEALGEFGPIRQCFVVTEKGSPHCKGFGYVTFALPADAAQALKGKVEYHGHKLITTVAKKKPPVKKTKPSKTEAEEAATTEEPAWESQPRQRPTLELSGLPPALEPEMLESLCRQRAGVLDVARVPDHPTKVHVSFSTVREATTAMTFWQQNLIQGKRVSVVLLYRPGIMKKSRLRARLIVRNLSFKCSQGDLKRAFSPFGIVLEVNIPKKPDGKMKGFGFVQFTSMPDATRALKEMNSKEIKGRAVSVDWALAKDKYELANASKAPGKKAEGKQGAINGGSKGPAGDEDKDDEDDEDKEKEEDTECVAQAAPPGRETRAGPRSGDGDPESESGSDEGSTAASNDDDDDAHGDDGSDDESDDEDGSDDEDDDEESDGEKKRAVNRNLPSDVGEGKTVFIRNLSFDSEEGPLGEVLTKFGKLRYVRVVLHPDTEHSKGCAFAQFHTAEAAQACIAATQGPEEAGGLALDGRRLVVCLAVSRDEARTLADKRDAKPTDRRNLYLAREGLIRAGTAAAEGLGSADLAKRERFEQLKRQKLRRVTVFVSRTRLCVHNIPKSADDKKLRSIFLCAGGPGARITECRIMRDMQVVNSRGLGQSKGFGFVEFVEHEHALTALRSTNNNPAIFGPAKRLIVEFSLEDRVKLNAKEARLLKSRQKQAAVKGKGNVAIDVAGGGAGGVWKGKASGNAKGQKGMSAVAQESRGSEPHKTGAREPGRAKVGAGGAVGKGGGGTGRWAGFQTRVEEQRQEEGDGPRRKLLPLPSHSGPKIRKRDKGKPLAMKRDQKPKNKKSRAERRSGGAGGEGLPQQALSRVPAGVAPAHRTPVQRTLVQRTLVQRTPVQRTPAQSTPAQRTPRAEKRAHQADHEERRFGDLVKRYKQRIFGSEQAAMRPMASKWFQE